MKKLLILSIGAAMLAACSKTENAYDASGVFETTEVIVSARGTGELVQFHIEEGQEVKADSILGCIGTTQLVLKRRQILATLSATESRTLDVERQVASLKQQIANAQSEKARFEKLVAAKAASQKQLDDINYQIEVLNKQLAASSEQLSKSNAGISEQAQSIVAQVAQIDDQLENCRIVSPMDGKILSKYAEQGEYAVPGRALFKVGDISNMKLRAYLSADQVTRLQIGQKVTVFADLGKEDRKAYEGTVIWISDEAEFTPKTIQTRDERSNLVYAVKIAVKNDGTIKRGMYGDVKF